MKNTAVSAANTMTAHTTRDSDRKPENVPTDQPRRFTMSESSAKFTMISVIAVHI